MPAMMTAEQRFMLELQGFLVVEDALSASELAAAREAMDRYSNGVFHGEPALPPGFRREDHARASVSDPSRHGAWDAHLVHAFAFDRAIEALCVHRAIWPIILELTDSKVSRRTLLERWLAGGPVRLLAALWRTVAAGVYIFLTDGRCTPITASAQRAE